MAKLDVAAVAGPSGNHVGGALQITAVMYAAVA